MGTLNKEMSTDEYNNIPVLYCQSCLSLKVKSVPYMAGMDYCDSCSSTDIKECHIEEWENLYKERYGHKYLDKY